MSIREREPNQIETNQIKSNDTITYHELLVTHILVIVKTRSRNHAFSFYTQQRKPQTCIYVCVCVRERERDRVCLCDQIITNNKEQTRSRPKEMARSMSIKCSLVRYFFLIITFLFCSNMVSFTEAIDEAKVFNVMQYGAIADGKTDNSKVNLLGLIKLYGLCIFFMYFFFSFFVLLG